LLNGRVVYLNILFGKRWAAPFRYILLAVRTFGLLRRENPSAVFAQNPPIFCPLVVVAVRRTMNFRLIVDHHAVWSVKSIRTPVLSNVIAGLERFVVRRADANITPNNNWTRQFQEMGARNAFTYHDFLEERTAPSTKRTPSVLDRLPPHRFLAIAAHGGHPEELLEAEVAAVQGLKEYALVITGRREKIGQRLAKLNLSGNVVYAGYLEQADYEALKRGADVALSLSKEPNTVPHAIHEFLSYRIPTIILKDDLLRSIFDGAVVEAEDARPDSIRNSLTKTCEDPAYRAGLLESIERNYEKRSKMHQDEIARLRQVLAN
jgi:glycosyltransferase involved in cell wall biosynthesis